MIFGSAEHARFAEEFIQGDVDGDGKTTLIYVAAR